MNRSPSRMSNSSNRMSNSSARASIVPRSLADVMKSSPRRFENARKIYINGGDESSIFSFLQTSIEKLTKADYSLIATLEYDDVEKYDYLYINANNMIREEKSCEDGMNDGVSPESETSHSEFKSKSTDRLNKELRGELNKSITSNYLTASPVNSLRGRKRSSDTGPNHLSRKISIERHSSKIETAEAVAEPIICENRIKNFDNILGRILSSQTTIIENNFTHADTRILPPVKCAMGIPIFCASLMVGIVCLAGGDKFTPKSLEKIEDLVEDCAMYMMFFKEKKSDFDKKNAIQRIKMGSWDGIVDIDHYGKIMEMNGSAEEIIGQSQHELYGKKFIDLIPSKKLRKGIADYIQTIFNHDDSESADNSSISLETKHKLLGDTGELYLKKYPRDSDAAGKADAGNPTASKATADKHPARTFVTLRFIKLSSKTIMVMIRQVDDIVRDKQIAEQSNEYKNMFVANVTHELKTPLNGIIGMGVQLLKPI